MSGVWVGKWRLKVTDISGLIVFHSAGVFDLHVHCPQGLDPVFDGRSQPGRRRPTPAADTEQETQADQHGPEPPVQQQGAQVKADSPPQAGLSALTGQACPDVALAADAVCEHSAASRGASNDADVAPTRPVDRPPDKLPIAIRCDNNTYAASGDTGTMTGTTAKLPASVEEYFTDLRGFRASGGANQERSLYGPLGNLQTAVGATLRTVVALA